MAANAVGSPPLDAGAELLVDWLELCAFCSTKSVARLDELDGVLTIQKEEKDSDDANASADEEDRRAEIELEMTLRNESLGDAYPFELSEDGEELILKQKGRRRGASFYLICLILSHATRSPILETPPKPRLLARARRREFQILSTLAVAGHIGGSSLSFGWPRACGSTIVQAVDRACHLSGTGSVRNPPGPVASKYAKDGGMDVIGWRSAVNNLPPPAEVCFGQAASGHGWREKNAPDEVQDFYESFYLDRPACQEVGVTIVPFRLSVDDHAIHGRRHGHILDRLRTPRAAVDGVDQAQLGAVVDEINRTAAIAVWLGRYKRQLSQAN